MKHNQYHRIIAVLFLLSIFGCGIATLLMNPLKIAGGLVRGYINSDSTLQNRIKNALQTFENRIDSYFVFRDEAINAYGLVQNVIGKTQIDDVDPQNTVVKLQNGYLGFIPSSSPAQHQQFIDYLTNLNQHCNTLNIRLLYVQKDSKQTNDPSVLPTYYPVTPSSSAGLVDLLARNGIAVLSIPQHIKETGKDKYSFFYKTDHHWTPETGLWVSKLISEKVNSSFNFNLDTSLLNPSQFIVEAYPGAFLGSQGKRVGRYYAGTDDFHIIAPLYNTDFYVEYHDRDAQRSGDFNESFFFRENLNPDRILTMDTSTYDVYMDGNHGLINILNHTSASNKKCLFIIDSFGCVTAPYLALVFDQTDCIDIRYYNGGKLEDYIVQTHPDVVIYMVDYGQN